MGGTAAMRVPNTGPDTGPARRSPVDWLLDTIAFLLAAAWLALIAGLWQADYLADITPVPDGLLVADVAAGAAATGAVWLRRRWPVGLAVVLVPTGLFSMAAAMAAMIALFSVAVRHRPAVTLALAGGYAVTGLPFFAYQINPLQPQMPYWWNVLWSTVVVALVVGWGLFARARVQLLRSLHERALRAEAEQQLRAEQARHLERERIAREMHDVLAHRISLVSMYAGGLEFRRDASPEQVAHAAGVIRRGAHQALEDLREVIGVLRADTPDGDTRPQPTLVDLPALLEEVRRADVQVQCDNRVGDPSAVPDQVARTAYRIVQEGLTNARKHAPDAAIDVSVSGAADAGLTIEVRNPAPPHGAGAVPIPGTGTGLVGLAERAALAGGRLEHGPDPGGGYRLWAWLPWPA